MSNQANRKAWERIQQNAEYLENYQKWSSRQLYFYEFTGYFFTWEEKRLNESGRKYADDLFDIMFTERTVNQNSQYQAELREAISEVKDMDFLESDYFAFLKAGVAAMVKRLEYLSACHKSNFQPEIPSKGKLGFSRDDFRNEFQRGLKLSMESIWLRLIEAARPYSPFWPSLWPLDPLSDYEEVKQYDLMDKDGAVSFMELIEDGKSILVKIDLQMPDKFISERIKSIVQCVRKKHGIKKAVGSGTLKGTRRGMLGVSKELSEQMEKNFYQHRSVAQLTREYYELLKSTDDQPLSDYVDITESRIYRKIYRWSKTLDLE